MQTALRLHRYIYRDIRSLQATLNAEALVEMKATLYKGILTRILNSQPLHKLLGVTTLG